MKKLGIFFLQYGPYHLARLKGLYEHCNSLKWDVVAIELTRSSKQYPWLNDLNNYSYPIRSLFAEQKRDEVKLSQKLKQIYFVLNKTKPDVLAICGYSDPTALAALFWCLSHRRPAILLSESKEDDAPRSWWTEKFKSLLIKTYKAALVGGSLHKSYLMQLGMEPSSIFFGYNVVGNEDFHPDKIRSLPKPHQKPYFLAINRFIPKKNLSFLISAYANYHDSIGSDAWDLILCGDGELRYKIEEQIVRLGLKDSVYLPGFLQQDQLLPYLAHAGCFIHASIHEQWGLVVNEAMAAGLPVIVSNHCGCFEDLVLDGVNGFSFSPNNIQQLTELMLKMSSGKIDLKQMSNAALEHIKKFSPDYFAQGLIQAADYTFKQY